MRTSFHAVGLYDYDWTNPPIHGALLTQIVTDLLGRPTDFEDDLCAGNSSLNILFVAKLIYKP